LLAVMVVEPVARFEFAWDEAYSLTCWKRRRQATWWVPVFLAIRVLGILVMLAIAGLALEEGDWTVAVLVLLAAVFFALSPAIDTVLLRRRARKSPLFGELFDVTLLSDGYAARSPRTETTISWESFTRAVSFPDGDLVYLDPQTPIWLAHAALSAGTPDDVGTLLAQRIPNYTRK
jgi:hypothetical protein